MQRTSLLVRATAIALGGALLASSASGQTPAKVPSISARQYTSGSARLTVTGSFRIDEDVKLNTMASVSDGEYTWLQFGASGSDSANGLVTIGEGGVGIGPGLGKNGATAELEHCKGKLDITSSLVSGTYTCTGVTSYNSATRKMGTIELKIRFTAETSEGSVRPGGL
jgi:hypothetical protein